MTTTLHIHKYSRIRSARTVLAKFFFKVSLAIVPEGHFLLWADQPQDETWLRIKKRPGY